MINNYVLVKVEKLWEPETKIVDYNCYFIAKINSQKYDSETKLQDSLGNDYFGEVIWFYNIEYNEIHFNNEEIICNFGNKEPTEKQMQEMENTHPEYWI
jgi:hypothetical protein